MLAYRPRYLLSIAAAAIAVLLFSGAGVASAAVLYFEDFEDTELEADTTTNFATIADGIAGFNDNSATTRARFVVRRTFDEPVMTFAFDVVAPVTAHEGFDNELVFRAGIGTANNTLGGTEFILEAILWRSSGGGTGGGPRGDFLNNGNETMFLVANNQETPLLFTSPIDGSIVTLGAFQYIPYIRDNETGEFGTIKGISDFTDRNPGDPVHPGTIIRFGIGNSSNGHQGTFALDNVLVESGVSASVGEVVPEPSSILLATVAMLGLTGCRWRSRDS